MPKIRRVMSESASLSGLLMHTWQRECKISIKPCNPRVNGRCDWLELWMKTGREIPVPTDTVYRINRPHTVFAGKTGNGKPTPYFRQERERNRLRDFPDRIHGSRI